MGRCQFTDFWLFDRLFRLVLPLRRFRWPVAPAWPVLRLSGLLSVLRIRLEGLPELELEIAIEDELFVDVAFSPTPVVLSCSIVRWSVCPSLLALQSCRSRVR